MQPVDLRLEPPEPARDPPPLPAVPAARLPLPEPLLLRLLQPGVRDVERHAPFLAELLQLAPLPRRLLGRPGLDRPLQDRLPRVGDDEVAVDLDHAPEAAALRAGPDRRVEGEERGRRLGHLDAALGAAQARVEPEGSLLPFPGDGHPASAVGEGLLERVDDPRPPRRVERDPVDDDEEAPVRGRRHLAQATDRARGEGADEALAPELLADRREVLRRSLRAVEGEEDRLPRVFPEELVRDVLGRPALERLPARLAVAHPRAGEEHLRVVVDLGDGPDRRAGGAHGVPLLDRHGGRDPLDRVDRGAVDPLEELARVGAEGLDVAPLPLGEEGVEGEGGLPRARDSGDDDVLPPRDLEVESLEVVLAAAAKDDPAVQGGHAHSGSGGTSRGGPAVLATARQRRFPGGRAVRKDPRDRPPWRECGSGQRRAAASPTGARRGCPSNLRRRAGRERPPRPSSAPRSS